MGILALVVGAWVATLAGYRRALHARWREPVFLAPVLVLESDDWGAGPAEQGPALRGLAALLAEFTNAAGEHPVMTLGVILAHPVGVAPDGTLAVETLADDAQAAVREAIHAGLADGVFAAQLHGVVHACEPALLRAAQADPAVADWLAAAEPRWTETLPSPLQSAWTDASCLPSHALATAHIQSVSAREQALWGQVFGAPPTVVVPTTFVWTEQVERAWDTHGVRVVITPGRRYTGRGPCGEPTAVDRQMLNGERGWGDLRYLVRDLYFEPSLGHDPGRLADGVHAHAALGRPALVEMHRFNFCGPRAHAEGLALLRDALARVLRTCPDVRFASSARIAQAIAARDPAWIVLSRRGRLRAWLRRVREIRGFWRLARITGLALPLMLAQRVVA
ncbi:MAG: hypothetical protein AB7O21_12875 [Gammaproteobacteria bacterium]